MSGEEWDKDYFEVNKEIEQDEYLNTDKVVLIDMGGFKVKKEKMHKFQKWLKDKVVTHSGEIQEDSLFLPTGPNPEKKNELYTLGYAFVEFCREDDAAQCIKDLDGKVKNKITFKAFPYSALEDYRQMDDKWSKPSEDDFSATENLHGWLLDNDTRDQFALRFADDTQIYWHDPLRRGQRDMKYGGERQKEGGKVWTELYVQWSSRGTYLCTFHGPGTVLWGGSEFKKLGRATHFGMEYLDFSPRENFFVTMRPSDDRKETTKAIRVWWTKKTSTDTGTQELVREFDGGYSLRNAGGKGMQWPVYKWCYDDSYFARINYKPEPFGTFIEIIDGAGADRPGTKKKPLKIDNLLNFEWSPSAPFLAYISSEKDNTPATIAIIDMENDSRRKLALKRLYRVYHPCIINFSDKAKDRYDFSTTMRWHPDGRYLACLVPRWGGKAKNKKLTLTNIQIFRVGQVTNSAMAEIPVEVLELECQVVYAFAWEPNGDRFAIIHSKYEVDARTEYVAKERLVSFYSLVSPKGRPELRLIATLGKVNTNNRRVTDLYWSPQGRHIVLLGKGNRNNGALEFYDVDRQRTVAGGPEGYSRCEHPSCNGGEWDPSGRYFCTYVLCPLDTEPSNSAQSDNGYQLWTFQGDSASKYQLRLHQFLWRPRPKSLLPNEKKEDIRKNLRSTFWDEFEEIDDKKRKAGWSKDMAERHKVLDEWRSYREEARSKADEIKAARIEIQGFDDEDGADFKVEEVEEEQVLNYREYRWKDSSNMRWQPDAPPPDGPEFWEDTTDQQHPGNLGAIKE